MERRILAIAQTAYKIALVQLPCPLGPENNDEYACDEAYYAARDAGANDEEARAIAMLLSDTLGDPRLD